MIYAIVAVMMAYLGCILFLIAWEMHDGEFYFWDEEENDGEQEES